MFILTRYRLLVVSNDRLEQIFETLITASVVLARDLKQQPFQRIETAKRMTRDGIRQAGAQHDELMLPLTLRSANGTPDRVVKTAQLALGARIHVPHAHHDDVRLVVQIKTVGDELFQFNINGSVKRPS